MTNNFLPNNYVPPATNSRYMRFEEGDNRFRVMSSAIVGWEEWENRVPKRTREMPEFPIDPTRPPKHFWAFVVWDYKDKAIKILEITQAGIQKAIRSYVESEDWGDPKGYDIIVKRKGKDLSTEYAVMAVPHKPTPEEANGTYDGMTIKLEKLFENGDPFEVA